MYIVFFSASLMQIALLSQLYAGEQREPFICRNATPYFFTLHYYLLPESKAKHFIRPLADTLTVLLSAKHIVCPSGQHRYLAHHFSRSENIIMPQANFTAGKLHRKQSEQKAASQEAAFLSINFYCAEGL